MMAFMVGFVMALSIPDSDKDVMARFVPILKDESTLVELEAQVNPDFPGCGLGHFWCETLKDAGVSSGDATRLTILPGHDNNYAEWYIDGKPTCVASGPHYHACEMGESNLLVCVGDDNTYGTGPQQAAAIVATLNNKGVHPSCPSCTVGRTMPHTHTVCMVPKGAECAYVCDVLYVANGTRICGEDGEYHGGMCYIPPVDTETHEMMSPSPVPSTSPSPTPSTVMVTQNDAVHENWTDYQQRLDDEETAEYQKLLSERACLYLLELENHWQEVGLMPRKPLRAHLYDAARAAECAWVHEEVFSTNKELNHHIPVRGDKGPWPKIAMPNVVHVRTTQGVFALGVNITSDHGRDLYKELGQRLSISPDELTIYTRDGIHPIDDERMLSSYNLSYSDILESKVGSRALASSKKQMLWKTGTIIDGDTGPLSPT